MSDNNLGEIYDKVYKNLKKSSNHVLTIEEGRLYFIISEILQESESCEKFCSELKIEPSNSLEEDRQFVEEKLSEVFTKCPFPDKMANKIVKMARVVSKPILNRNQNEGDSMKWLVVAACVLVGVYACWKYLEKQKYPQPQTSASPENRQPSPAELCLVVPALKVSSFQVGSEIDGNTLKELVSSASYFLCKSVTDALEIEKRLPLTDDVIPTDSPRGVYVGITIEGGEEMIDNKTRYEIKENLKDSQIYRVNKLNYLKSLSGLESFED